MATKAEQFHATLTHDEDISGMIAAVKAAGGDMWCVPSDWKVDFDDGSYWSASIWEPQDREPYYNGSPKTYY